MNHSDFDGAQKYKLLIPSFYIINWILIIVGPMFFPVGYQYYCAGAWIVMLCKMCYVDFNMLFVLKRTYDSLKKNNQNTDSQHQTLSMNSQITHCFIIPSFRQDPELIGQTISWVATHSRAKTNYMVMLAMQKHEDESDLKAQQLIKKYGKSFKFMDYTRHQIKPHEQKGKASNVTWCAQHLPEFFTKYSINQQNVLLSIIDADTWVPPLYIQKIDEYIDYNPQNFSNAIFVPPQIFTRNNMDVPMMTRIFDNTHSLAQLSNMRSNYDLIFPISNYSISFTLIKRIGFWDTCPDAIGEDFHISQKAFWKTNGEAFNVPIYVPFNNVNVQTGKGYFQDIEARFWQAQRHAQGCADVAYNLNMLVKTQLVTPKSLLLVYYVLQCFSLPAIMPWIAFSTIIQNNFFFYYWPRPQGCISAQTMDIIINLTTVSSFLFWGTFQIFKRYTNKKIYNKQNQSIWRLLEYPLVVAIDITIIAVPTFIIAAFRVLIKNRNSHYRVSEKKIGI